MPPKPLVDLSLYDLETVSIPIEEVRKTNLQRHEMEQISGILHLDVENALAIGFKDVTDREFWVRGHIPGRPLMPGVVMIESAAQVSTFLYMQCLPEMQGNFVGFGGVDSVRFRGTVEPGQRLLIVAKGLSIKRRLAVFQTQGIVDGKIIFEAKIIGVPV